MPSTGGNRHILSVAISPDGATVYATGQRLLAAFDVASGDPVELLDLPVRQIAISSRGELVGSSPDGSLAMFDPVDLHLVRSLPGGRGLMSELRFSADGSLLYGGSDEGTGFLYDMTTYERVGDGIALGAVHARTVDMGADGDVLALPGPSGRRCQRVEPRPRPLGRGRVRDRGPQPHPAPNGRPTSANSAIGAPPARISPQPPARHTDVRGPPGLASVSAMERPDDLHDLEKALLDGIAGLTPGEGDARPRRAAAGAVRRPGAEPRARPHGPPAARRAAAGSTRSARRATRATPRSRPRCGPPTRRCCTTARAAFYCARGAQRPGHDGVRDVLARAARARRRADRRRPPQGVRSPRPRASSRRRRPSRRTCRVPLGVAFAIGARSGSASPAAWPDDARRGVHVRRRLGEPLHRGGRDQHRVLHCARRAAGAAAVRVRGQRHGHQRAARRPAGSRRRSRTGRGLRYAQVDGTDPLAVLDATAELAEHVRADAAGRRCCTCAPCATWATPAPTSRPATAPPSGIRARLRPPTRCSRTARCDGRGRVLRTADELRRRVPDDAASTCRKLADDARATSRSSRPPTQVMAPLSPRRPGGGRGAWPSPPPRRTSAREAFGGTLPEHEGAAHARRVDQPRARRRPVLAPRRARVRRGRRREGRRLRRDPRAAEEVRRGPRVRHAARRAVDPRARRSAPAVSGLLPIPEIQYLAYLHNAEDQLRGEAASLPFFSNGQYRNPMVVRIAGLAYQKGFGGHFHNDNSVAVLRDIPGLVVASPAHPSRRGADAAHAAWPRRATDGTVCVFLEPIALYHTRDLHEPGDGVWTAPVPAARGVGAAPRADRRGPRGYGDGDDVLIVVVGQRPAPVAARGAPARGAGHRRAACSTCAGSRRCRSTRCSREARRGRPRAGRRRDPPRGRRGRGRGHRAGRGRRTRAPSRGSPPTTRSSRSATRPNLVLVGEDDIVAAAETLAQRPAQPALPWAPPAGLPAASPYTHLL